MSFFKKTIGNTMKNGILFVKIGKYLHNDLAEKGGNTHIILDIPVATPLQSHEIHMYILHNYCIYLVKCCGSNYLSIKINAMITHIQSPLKT